MKKFFLFAVIACSILFSGCKLQELDASTCEFKKIVLSGNLFHGANAREISCCKTQKYYHEKYDDCVAFKKLVFDDDLDECFNIGNEMENDGCGEMEPEADHIFEETDNAQKEVFLNGI